MAFGMSDAMLGGAVFGGGGDGGGGMNPYVIPLMAMLGGQLFKEGGIFGKEKQEDEQDLFDVTIPQVGAAIEGGNFPSSPSRYQQMLGQMPEEWGQFFMADLENMAARNAMNQQWFNQWKDLMQSAYGSTAESLQGASRRLYS